MVLMLPPRRALLTGSQWWNRYMADGLRPSLVADFRQQRYMLGGAGAKFSDIISFTRGSTATYIDSDGLIKTAAAGTPRFDYGRGVQGILLENAATNLILNSATLTTQSVTISAQSYTLSFYGSGSVTLSGAYSGTLSGTGSGRSSLTFTPAAGTLTITVTGSVQNAQLEAGSFATSYIPTTSAAVTRAIETARFSPAVESIFQTSAFGGFVKGSLRAQVPNAYIIGLSTATSLRIGSNQVGADARWYNGTADLDASRGSGAYTSGFGQAFAFDSSGRSLAINGGSVVTSASGGSGVGTQIALGRSMGDIASYAAGWFDQVVLYPFRLSNATLRALAVPYA